MHERTRNEEKNWGEKKGKGKERKILRGKKTVPIRDTNIRPSTL